MKTISKLIFTAVLGFSALGFQAKAEDFPEAIKPLMQKYTCFACHKVDARLVGPAYQDVAKKKYSVDKNSFTDCKTSACHLARLSSNGAYDECS